MARRRTLFLVLASAVNAGLCAAAFLLAEVAARAGIAGGAMGAGYHVLIGLAVAGFVGAVAPWALDRRGHGRAATALAALPAALVLIAVLAMPYLQGWQVQAPGG